MSYISQVYAKHLPQFNDLPHEDKKKINQDTIAYVFGFTRSNEYIKSLMKDPGCGLIHKFNESVPLKSALSTSGYLLKDIKLAVWNQHCLGGYTHRLQDGDQKIVALALQNTAFREYLDGLRQEGFKALSLKSFNNHLAKSYKDVFPWLLGYTKKHCSWIINSFSMEAHDIATELFERGYSAALMLYPRINSYDHMLNIMRLSIRNYVTNLHLKYSADSRNPLVCEFETRPSGECVSTTFSVENGSTTTVHSQASSTTRVFNSRTVSMQSMQDETGAGFDVDTALMIAGAIDSEDDDSFEALSLNQQTLRFQKAMETFADVYEYRLDPSEFIGIVSGNVSPPFAEFIKNKFRINSPVEDFIDNNSHLVFDNYCIYAGVAPAYQVELKQYLKHCFS